MKIKKIIASTMLVLTGLLIGCSVNTNTSQTVKASSSNYREDDLGRIRLVTYVDKDNGNVVYISYDTNGANGNRLQAVGMTSQPLNKK